MTVSEVASLDAGEHVLALSWSHDGRHLLVSPSDGPFVAIDDSGRQVATFAGHGFGNGCAEFHPQSNRLATCGTNGAIRLYPGIEAGSPEMEVTLGRDWIDRVRWSPSGERLATSSGKRLVILDENGNVECEFPDHKSAVCDFAWNPRNPGEIASVCDGGAHMWRLGESDPFARFDWGGASLLAEWSPDGRWLATGDQTPSVHIYDFTRDYPLHIQGYETKVKALSFNSASRQLATGGGRLVTVWSCTGKKGPEGTVPKQLQGHDGDCVALEWRRGTDLLASGGTDGLLILFEPGSSARSRAQFDAGCAISALAWHPTLERIAIGTEEGEVVLLDTPAS